MGIGVSSTYGTVEFENDQIILDNVVPHVAIRLKSMFARISKTQTKRFVLPSGDEMCSDLLWFMDRYPLEMNGATLKRLKAGAKRLKADRAALEAILLPDWQAPEIRGFRPGYALEPNQARANEIVKRRKRLLLGDDVGLGKTWVAMASAMRSSPTLVVVQTHLATQWTKEFIIPYTEMTAHIIEETTPYDLPKADIYVISYSKLAGWVDIFATGIFKRVVYDEVQELRTGDDSEKGRAALVLSNMADEIIGLSATPIFNYGSEIWNIMSYIDPDVLGPWDEFIREWCVMGAGDKWVVVDPDALGTYLKETGAFLRRVRDGRPINRIVVDVDYDEKTAKSADDLTLMLAQKVMSGSFQESGRAARELDALARRLTGLAKARGVAAYARILLTAGIPIIISGWHRDVYEIWLDELKEFNPLLYTGSESTSRKDKNKKAFIRGFARGGSDCMIISNRSGAGLDGLQTRCSTVLVGELDWSPQIYEQLFGRVDRRGQKEEEITAIFLVADGGSDPTIMAVNAIKRDQARGITDPGVGEAPVYSDVSHVKMLAQKYLEGKAA